MNIIVSQDKSIRLTQYSNQSTYNLEDINFYLAKTLNFDKEDVFLLLTVERNNYPFYLAKVSEVVNYYIYKISILQNVNLSARTYDLFLLLGEEKISLGKFELNKISYSAPKMRSFAMRASSNTIVDMQDEHEPIDIVDRDIRIKNNQNILVAQDNISQCITFRLASSYDGIDLYTDLKNNVKTCYIDYVDLADKKAQPFNIKINPEDISKDPTDDSLMLIKWIVPYSVTKIAGTVPFDLSIVGDTNNGDYYIWQTEPSSLTIKKNLGSRRDTPSENPDDLSVMAEIQKRLTQIEESDIYSLDADGFNNQEVLISGGGALEE